jgi:hypothetical protein
MESLALTVNPDPRGTAVKMSQPFWHHLELPLIFRMVPHLGQGLSGEFTEVSDLGLRFGVVLGLITFPEGLPP